MTAAGPWFGLSLMLDDDWREAAFPIFESGAVDVLEWSFDATPRVLPEWAAALLDHFADADRLLGHGVSFSLLSGRWEARQERYLERLRDELAARRHRHFSEHLGFATAAPFVQGTPLPQPWTEGTLRVGRDRLARLAAVAAEAGVPVGIENLALVGSPADARAQCAFLGELLRGEQFLVLDVHNLCTQSCNTGLAATTLLHALPLERVREVHVSGGSWSTPRCRPGVPFRRDTHDEAVPESVMEVLAAALPLCPRTEAVIFERIGGTLGSEEEVRRFREDAEKIRALVAAQEPVRATPGSPRATRPLAVASSGRAATSGDDTALAAFQSELLVFLAASHDPGPAVERLLGERPALRPFAEYLRGFEAPALEVASDLVRKWGVSEARAARGV